MQQVEFICVQSYMFMYIHFSYIVVSDCESALVSDVCVLHIHVHVHVHALVSDVLD